MGRRALLTHCVATLPRANRALAGERPRFGRYFQLVWRLTFQLDQWQLRGVQCDIVVNHLLQGWKELISGALVPSRAVHLTLRTLAGHTGRGNYPLVT